MAGQKCSVVLAPQPEDGFLVSVPDLPDVVTEGDTRLEALARAQDAIAGYLETMRGRDWPVTVPGGLP